MGWDIAQQIRVEPDLANIPILVQRRPGGPRVDQEPDRMVPMDREVSDAPDAWHGACFGMASRQAHDVLLKARR
jgi:hypothetical protein